MAALAAASATKVVVAWGKQNLEVEINPASATLQWFQEHLEALTGVLVARQKFILKGKKIQSDEDVRQLQPGTKIIMMGVATELPKPPKEQILFMEDMSAADQAKAGVRLGGVGLQNLGNTCYMNSTLQCLKGIPELRSALVSYAKTPAPRAANPAAPRLIQSLGRLFEEMDSTDEPVVPIGFTTAFRKFFPQFDEQDERGRHKQQDAEEAFSQLVSEMANCLGSSDAVKVGPVGARPASKPRAAQVDEVSAAASAAVDDSANPEAYYQRKDNLIDQLFGGELEMVEQCVEAPEEAPVHSVEGFRRLQCHIDMETNFVFQGLERQLKEQREKLSPSLQRNAVYERRAKISALPPYLVVQFVRFYWRSDNNSKTKIVRRVKFPAELDVMPFCSDDLKSSLANARKLNVAREDERLGLAPAQKSQQAGANSNAMVDDDEVEDGKVAVAGSAADEELPPNPVTSGMYRLTAAVTHQGRMAEAGHYVGWVRQEGSGEDDWLMFDDAKVKPVKESDVLQLDGASVDWHISYLIIYQRVDDMTPEGQKLKEEKRKRDAEARLANKRR